MTSRVVALVLLLALFYTDAKDFNGMCGVCSFMNTTHVVGCVNRVKYTGWQLRNGAYQRFLHENVCLGNPTPTDLNVARVLRTVALDRDTQKPHTGGADLASIDWFDRTWGKYEPYATLELVNLFAQTSHATVRYLGPEAGTSFGQVVYDQRGMAVADFAAFQDLGGLPWSNTSVRWLSAPWASNDQNTIVFVGVDGTDDPTELMGLTIGQPPFLDGGQWTDEWSIRDCKRPFPQCLPDGWHAKLLSGKMAVSMYRLWCAATGVANAETGVVCPGNCGNNGTSCQTEAQLARPECANANQCMASGYCRCRHGEGGPNCEQPKPYPSTLPDAANIALPCEWRGDVANVSECATWNKADTANWYDWTCATYNPCSGNGRCVDPPYDPVTRTRRPIPRCECHPGWFGNSTEHVEAYARVFFCDADGAEWSDGEANNYAVRRYMMMHQCMLWNGPDRPARYQLATTAQTRSGPVQYRPLVPSTCAPGHVGPLCVRCPDCVKGQGTCAVSSADPSVAVCECTNGDYTGALCELKKCPFYRDSPCGSRAKDVKRGECVPTLSGSAWKCECDNGYGGDDCGIRLCGKDDGTPLMCSGSSLTRYGPQVSEPHGECRASADGKSGTCVCLPGFTGPLCEQRQCPIAPGTTKPCNGLVRYGTQISVCNNADSSVLAPVCECHAARPPLATFPNKGCPGLSTPECNRQHQALSWWGEACERPFNETCSTPGSTNWCGIDNEDPALCAQPVTVDAQTGARRVLSDRPPVCACPLLGDKTGPRCDQSKCGTRFEAGSDHVVPAHEVCRGYNEESGRCSLLKVAKGQEKITDPEPIFAGEDPDKITSGAIVLPYGRCDCSPTDPRGAVRTITFGGVSLRTGFVGAFCQTPVPGCTDPAGNICGNTPGETRGVCIDMDPADNATVVVPYLNTDALRNAFRHRCRCVAGYNGTFCQFRQAICNPPCKPTAGVCRSSSDPLLRGGYCECRGPGYLYTDPNQAEQCGVDTCAASGGITTLETAECLCPKGKAPTITVNAGAGVSGCRTMCPVDPVTGDECGVPDGEFQCSNRKIQDMEPDGPVRDPRTLAELMAPNPRCRCGPRKWTGVAMIGEGAPLELPTTGLAIMLAPDQLTCMPVCGHGSTYFTRSSDTVPCSCGSSPDPMVPICQQYTRESFYHTHKCNNRGRWTKTSGCVCDDPTWYTAASNCASTICEQTGGTYVASDRAMVCNCTHPFRADTDRTSKTYRQCVSDCGLHGRASAATRKCVCDWGWAGAKCDRDLCAPYGRNCGGKCCCLSTAVQGEFCEASACGAHGELVRSADSAPVCRCTNPLFSGANCEIDTCGIIGDGGVLTGRFVNTRCQCVPGYDVDSTGRCTRGLCGRYGTVVQDAGALSPTRGYRCQCSGPDQLNSFGWCQEGACGHGVQVLGAGGQKIACQCEAGWSGPRCDQSACAGDHFVYDQGACRCIYPFGGPSCDQPMCGPGGTEVVRINYKGNPLRYECVCNTRAGYALVQVPSELQAPGTWPCVNRCNLNHTARIDPVQGCVCKVGYVGAWCDDPQVYEPQTCPTVAGQVVSKGAVIGTISAAAVGWVAAIALAVVCVVRTRGQRYAPVQK